LYSWHGTVVPEQWILDKSFLTPDICLQQSNIELRRSACEILGWDKILDNQRAIIIDADPNVQIGTLYQMDLPDSPEEYFLKYTCGTGREFIQNVDPCKTAREAQIYIWNDPEYDPEFRT